MTFLLALLKVAKSGVLEDRLRAEDHLSLSYQQLVGDAFADILVHLDERISPATSGLRS